MSLGAGSITSGMIVPVDSANIVIQEGPSGVLPPIAIEGNMPAPQPMYANVQPLSSASPSAPSPNSNMWWYVVAGVMLLFKMKH